MKHRGITLVTLVLITVFVCGTAAADDSYLKFLPDDAVLFASVTNIDELRTIAKDEKLLKLLEVLNLKDSIEFTYAQMASGFAGETGLEFNQFIDGFNGDCTLVLFEGMIESGTPNLAIYFGIDPEVFPYETLIQRAIEREAEDATPHTVKGVNAIAIEDGPTVAIHDGHMFIATSPDILGKLFDSGNRLSASPLFSKHVEYTHLNSGAVLYVDVKKTIQLFSNFLPPDGTEEGDATEMVVELLGLNYITSFSAQVPLATDEPMRAFIHAPGYEGLMTEILSPQPIGIDMAALMPATCDSCGAFSIRKPTQIIDSILGFVGNFAPGYSPTDFYAMLEPAEKELEISFRTDVFDTLGTKLCMGLEIDTTPPEEPMPLATAYFKMLHFHIVWSLDAPDTLLSSLRKLIEAQQLPLVESEYKGANVFVVDIGMLPVTPTFAIHGSGLLFTMDYDLMTSWLDALASGRTLAGNSEFMELTAGIPKEASMFGYVSDAYLTKYLDALENFLLIVLPEEEEEQEGEFDLRNQIVATKAALLDYIGTDNGGSSYVLPTAEGLYMEGAMKTKVLIGMVPVWISLATMDFADFGEAGEFEDDYDEYYEDEEDEEPHEVPHAPLLH